MQIEKVTTTGLNLGVITALVEREIGAVVVDGFIADPAGLWSVVQASENFRFDGPHFRGLGPGSFDLPAAKADYAATAAAANEVLKGPRESLAKAIGLDLLAPSLGGFSLSRPLTVRSYGAEFSANPHQDTRVLDQGDALGMIGMSCSLVPPTEGGRIGVWNMALEPDAYQAHTLPDSWQLDPKKLAEPDAYFNPSAGCLLLIDATRIHSIESATVGHRISMSGFLALSSGGDEVFAWS